MPVIKVQSNDVLCGRGGSSNNHAGNERFRAIVAQHQSVYLHSRRKEKTAVADRIVTIIHEIGGRFLKHNEEKDVWEEIPQKKAVEKCSQALREGLQHRRHEVRHLTADIGLPSLPKGGQQPLPNAGQPPIIPPQLPSGAIGNAVAQAHQNRVKFGAQPPMNNFNWNGLAQQHQQQHQQQQQLPPLIPPMHGTTVPQPTNSKSIGNPPGGQMDMAFMQNLVTATVASVVRGGQLGTHQATNHNTVSNKLNNKDSKENSNNIDGGTMLELYAQTLQNRCMRTYGWNLSFTVRVWASYKQFLELKRTLEDWNDKLLSPSVCIGHMWEQHVLDNRHYEEYCRLACDDCVIYFNPDAFFSDRDDVEQRLKSTKLALKARFSDQVDWEIWGAEGEKSSSRKRKRDGKKNDAVDKQGNTATAFASSNDEKGSDSSIENSKKRKDRDASDNDNNKKKETAP